MSRSAAPISWGVCEVPGWGHQLAPGRVFAEIASLGIKATELGPIGYLPFEPQAIREQLDRHGLTLVGGFVPLVLHEQNSVAGTTNRLLAPLAAKVFAAFPDAFPASARAELVGNPVRASLVATDNPRERLGARLHERRRLFVIGGSQGARIMADIVPGAIAKLDPGLRARLRIVQQAREEDLPRVQAADRGAYRWPVCPYYRPSKLRPTSA